VYGARDHGSLALVVARLAMGFELCNFSVDNDLWQITLLALWIRLAV
jgi:hypothetical protein